MISLDTTYKLLREAFMALPPKDLKCQYPQSFAVISHYSDLNAPNLGKTVHDLRENYFWSRAWDAKNNNPKEITFAYPLGAVQHFNFEAFYMGRKNSKVCHNLTLGVYDVIQPPCVPGTPDCNPCKSRNFHQIETDTEAILFKALSYLKVIQKATIDGGPEGYYAKPYLDYLKTTDAVVNILVPKVQFIDDSEPFYGVRADTGIDTTVGTEVRIKLCTNVCFDDEYNFDNVEPITQIGCCG